MTGHFEPQVCSYVIYSALLAAHRTACLRHDEIGQATLLNLLLRNYLSQNLYEQAFKLVSKTSFPETVSNNQYVRYLYYVGKIQAVQLDYTDAHTKLMQAIRKAPQNTALGFRREAQKLAIIVQLLMGEMPERSIFNQEGFQTELAPYLQLTNVRMVVTSSDLKLCEWCHYLTTERRPCAWETWLNLIT